MGRSKALLSFGKKTVIETVVETAMASRASEVIVVLGHAPDPVRQRLTDYPVRIVENPAHAEGMLSSVRAGLQAAQAESSAFLVLPVDQPGTRTATLDAVIAAHVPGASTVCVASFGGQRGHPILVPVAFRAEVMEQFDGEGLRGLLRAHPEEVCLVELDDPCIVQDLDTPSDYYQALGARKE